MPFVRRVANQVLIVIAAIVMSACSPAAAAPSVIPTASPSFASVATSQPSVSPTPTPSPKPKPSPMAVLDGEAWIAFNWYLGANNTKDLILARPDGTGLHAIARDIPGEHTGPSWSPDGMRIAFTNRDDATPNGSIWITAADGTGSTLLTDGGGACPDGIFHPNWSPDGTKIAVICYPDPAGKQGSVATVDVATKKVTRLYTVDWPEHLDGPPSWAPDGKTLTFAILHWDPTNDFITGSLVATVPATGGKATRLTTFATNMSYPAWSPDGSEIVMHSYDLGNMHTTEHASNLYAMKPDGSGQRQITHSSVDGSMRIAEPQWTPDGTRILVSVATGPRASGPVTVNDVELALVDPAGGEPVLFSPTIHGSRGDFRPIP